VPAPAAVDPAPAQPAPVINVVLPPSPPAGDTTGTGVANSGGNSNTGSGTSGGPAQNTKPSGGIATSHLNDKVLRSVAAGSPAPGSTGTFGNTAANPGGSTGGGSASGFGAAASAVSGAVSAGGPAPGAGKTPSAVQRLFP
jgi:hypothetical protein